jgi:hypothetical protein
MCILRGEKLMEILFIHLLDEEKKSESLENVISEISNNKRNSSIFLVNDKIFKAIEDNPLAYYAPPSMLTYSGDGQILKSRGISARQGIGASTRFHRLLWEVPIERIGIDWFYMAHGTSPSKFYKPTTHLFLWAHDGIEAKADVNHRYPYLNGNYGFKIQAENYYKKPGLCYGKRTENFTVQVLPENHLFSFEGTAIFTDSSYLDEWSLLGLLNSKPINQWLSAVCAEHKAYNYIDAIPIPPNITESDLVRLRVLAQKGWKLKRDLDLYNLTSPVFIKPALFRHTNMDFLNEIDEFIAFRKKSKEVLDLIQNEIDNICLDVYDIKTPLESFDDFIEHVEVDETPDEQIDNFDTSNLVKEGIDYLIGVLFGRWNILADVNNLIENGLPSPFDVLPSYSPGMLIDREVLASSRKKPQTDYPLRISWNGILVDDESQVDDIESRTRDGLNAFNLNLAEVNEQEACQLLGVHSLREYFRKSTLFFTDHLKRYSKSRRTAPIYWPLSTPSCSYTLWLYYHRLNDQTLYTCVNDFVDPKLKQVSEEAARLRLKKGRSAADEKELERLTDFERELKDFREELLRVAKFWKPNLNDGVEITAAPLWKLFQHKPWQKRLKETWQKLEAGEYDWAHLAYSIWPDRVREKCKSDKSLAIAHDLESLYVEPPVSAKKKKAKKQISDEESEGWFNDD